MPRRFVIIASGTACNRRPVMKLKVLTLAASTLIFSGGLATAQQGPVGSACIDDIQKFCAGMEHGQGQVRACLEDNKDQVSAACRTALETTRGPGRAGQRMGQGVIGQRMGQGMGQRGWRSDGMERGYGGGMMMGGMGHGGMMRIMFAIADADGDGALSLEEVQELHARIFAHVDADGDDRMTLEEMQDFFRGPKSALDAEGDPVDGADTDD
jgi:hypothetical protein